MASVAPCRSLALVLVVVVAISVTESGSAAGSNKSFNITNNCSYTVWPGILSRAAPGESHSVPVPTAWSGVLWGRTLCSSDAATGKFTCLTGDCGSGRNENYCAGRPTPPVTLVQFTFDGSGGMDLYDVSLVDGFNVAVLVAPGGNCAPAGCAMDLNAACPAELRVITSAGTGTGVAVACKSACLAFGSPEYCCKGAYGTPSTCKPSAYSELFKHACPGAYSFAYDGAASTFTCGGGGDTTYAIAFCPKTTRGSSRPARIRSRPPPGDQPHVDVTVFAKTGGSQFPAWGVVAGALSLLAAVLGIIIVCVKYMMQRKAEGAVNKSSES